MCNVAQDLGRDLAERMRRTISCSRASGAGSRARSGRPPPWSRTHTPRTSTVPRRGWDPRREVDHARRAVRLADPATAARLAPQHPRAPARIVGAPLRATSSSARRWRTPSVRRAPCQLVQGPRCGRRGRAIVRSFRARLARSGDVVASRCLSVMCWPDFAPAKGFGGAGREAPATGRRCCTDGSEPSPSDEAERGPGDRIEIPRDAPAPAELHWVSRQGGRSCHLECREARGGSWPRSWGRSR